MLEVKTDLKIDLNNLDKSDWKTYRFDEIAKNISERVDPNNTDLKVYIGLEHIDSESLHIRRHGTPDDVNGTKLKFYKGDIIFGRRRAYQRKAGIADTDGFCSAHALVLRANPDVIDPELFPFFLHSDVFMNRAIDISVGSLSPTINWGTLKHQEFLIPPLELQQSISNILWLNDELIQKESSLLDSLNTMLSVHSSELIWKKCHKKSPLVTYASKKLGKLCDGDWIESKDQSESGVRLLQLADIGVGRFINKSRRYVSESTFNKLKCFEVLPGDVLIARMPEPIGRACIVEDVGLKMITAVDCCVARVDESHSDPEFLMYLLNTREFLHKANMLASGTTRQRISRKNLENIKVPKPSYDEQIQIKSTLRSCVTSINSAINKLTSSRVLKCNLINKVF